MTNQKQRKPSLQSLKQRLDAMEKSGAAGHKKGSFAEAINECSEQIMKLMNMGFSNSQIYESFKVEGYDIPFSTFSIYLGRNGITRKKAKNLTSDPKPTQSISTPEIKEPVKKSTAPVGADLRGKKQVEAKPVTPTISSAPIFDSEEPDFEAIAKRLEVEKSANGFIIMPGEKKVGVKK